MVNSRPPSTGTGQAPPAARGAARQCAALPRKKRWRSRIAGLLGLTGALTLCALAACALFIPMTVFGAQPATPGPGPEVVYETTVPVQTPQSSSTTTTQATLPVAGGPVNSAATIPVTAPVSSGALLVTLPWGSGDGQVGLASPTDGLVRGPEALAVAPDGRMAVLDSVNKRVLFLDAAGAVTGSAPVSLREPRFLAVTATRVYVLDCDADRRLVQMGWNGSVYGTAALPALADAVSGLFATSTGPCVEVAHDVVYRLSISAPKTLGDAEGNESDSGASSGDVLPSLFGRPADLESGRQVKVSFEPGGDPTAVAYTTATMTSATSALDLLLPAGRTVDSLVSVDGLAADGLIVGARLDDAEASTQSLFTLRRFVFATDGTLLPAKPVDGGEDAMLLVDWSVAYVGQPYVVARDGRVFQPVAAPDGYSIFVHTFGGGAATEGTTNVQTGGM